MLPPPVADSGKCTGSSSLVSKLIALQNLGFLFFSVIFSVIFFYVSREAIYVSAKSQNIAAETLIMSNGKMLCDVASDV